MIKVNRINAVMIEKSKKIDLTRKIKNKGKNQDINQSILVLKV